MKPNAVLMVVFSLALIGIWMAGPCRADTNDITDGAALGVGWFSLVAIPAIYYTHAALFCELTTKFPDTPEERAAHLQKARNYQLLGTLAFVVGVAAPAIMLEGDKRKGCYIPLTLFMISQMPSIVSCIRDDD